MLPEPTFHDPQADTRSFNCLFGDELLPNAYSAHHHDAGKHLLNLINDVLDLSKIEASQLTLDLGDYSLKDAVHTVVTAVKPLATSKSTRRSVRALLSLSPCRCARNDRRRAMANCILVVEDQQDNRQILRDLLGNAGFDLIEAENGEQVLAALAKQRPDSSQSRPCAKISTMSDNRSSVVNLSRPIALAPRTRCRSRPHGARRGGLG